MKRIVAGALFLVFSFMIFHPVLADDFLSDDFRIQNPIITYPAGYSSSGDFQLHGVLSQPAIGESDDGSVLFSGKAGFLYFPFSSTPVLTATAGDASVLLSWTAATTALGWTVGSYTIGQATVSGGPYAYTAVGLTTSSTASGLTNGTTYYFVVRVNDVFGNGIATSTEVSAVPVAGAVTPVILNPPGGGPILEIYRRLFDPIISIFKKCRRSDLNCDGRVNLYDIGILFYWWHKPIANGPFLSRIAALVGLGKPSPDLKEDNKIDIYDLSVMLSDWTS